MVLSLASLSVGWLILGWFFRWLAGWLVDWLTVGWFFRRLVHWYIDRLAEISHFVFHEMRYSNRRTDYFYQHVVYKIINIKYLNRPVFSMFSVCTQTLPVLNTATYFYCVFLPSTTAHVRCFHHTISQHTSAVNCHHQADISFISSLFKNKHAVHQ
jgi:hypothetical protein